ncbi:hypothetical protein GCM10009114_01050 [Aliiglaciecola litoralis]|uniref:Uncharacterized protein n=1 Tax=Aliiglaciecola litoralis TaxID=582857 RepID=A0ABN1LBV4_9ALTE
MIEMVKRRINYDFKKPMPEPLLVSPHWPKTLVTAAMSNYRNFNLETVELQQNCIRLKVTRGDAPS